MKKLSEYNNDIHEFHFYCFRCGEDFYYTPQKGEIFVFKNKHGDWDGVKCLCCGRGNAKIIGRRVNIGGGGNWELDMNEQRAEHFNSLVQPYRDGVASKEFIEAHPEQAKKLIPKEERAKAKHVWKDLPGWNRRKDSK